MTNDIAKRVSAGVGACGQLVRTRKQGRTRALLRWRLLGEHPGPQEHIIVFDTSTGPSGRVDRCRTDTSTDMCILMTVGSNTGGRVAAGRGVGAMKDQLQPKRPSVVHNACDIVEHLSSPMTCALRPSLFNI